MAGADCWGLLKLVYADLGFRLFDIENLRYGKTWGLKGDDYFSDNYFHDWERAEKPSALDSVLFLNSRGVANHAGIVLAGGRFIHCCRAGVVVSRLGEASWKPRIEGFYRLRTRTW